MCILTGVGKRRIASWVTTLWLVALPAVSWNQEPPHPAQLIGERLEFRLRWGVVPAADAALEVLDAGEGRITFRATARTLPYVDWIYPVRDLVESTARSEGLRVERYFKDAREGRGRQRIEEIVFDLQQGLAHYTRDGRAEEPLAVPGDVQDPLSCLYAYRSLFGAGGEPVVMRISDGRKVVDGRVHTRGSETVTTPAGTFDTVIIEPEIEGLGGIFRKSPGAKILIWLTDDAWRRPVKLQSEVAIGRFTAELTRWVHPAAGSPPQAAASNRD